ncbi:MAG TPA: O-methyltransferase [Allosphingosinicella sp.]|nr:O-methyltransferase [Allosphingosinicella sp.]
MPSFDAVNYSLRPSKSIQRHIVFEAVRTLQNDLDLDNMVYIGFGSIWFTDYVMAHKILGINEMVSIEASDVGFRRAEFNAPLATVRVIHGHSSYVLPTLYEDEKIRARPWFVWLDYDYELNETLRDDIRSVIENAPANSLLLVTFNGAETRYGQASDRPGRLQELLGDVVPDELSKRACKDDRMQETLADLALDFMTSVAADLARPGGFIPSFRLIYKDGAPMVTIGGIMPSKGAARIAGDITSTAGWPCRPERPIRAPHLTIREAATLQSQLPSIDRLTREAVRKLGFDLEDEQIEAFEAYYRHYPAFAQIVA